MPSILSLLRHRKLNVYDVINVKTDYGAVGNGVTDDTAAIQAAFDAAFGSAASPHGSTNRALNKDVFFPAGAYSISSPLYLTGVVGGRIFGAGANCSRIRYDGALNGNTVAQGNLLGSDIALVRAITPVIMINGWAYSEMSDLNLSITDNGSSTCLYIFSNGAVDGGPTIDSYRNILLEGGTSGVLIGYKAPGLCSEQLFLNVSAQTCTYGFRNISPNALNNIAIGCSAGGCVTGFSCPTGSLQIICASLAGNTTADIAVGQETMTIIGSRTETSTSGIFIDMSGASAPAYVSGCTQAANGGSGPFASMGIAGQKLVIDSCVQTDTNSANGKIIGSTGKVYIRGCDFRNTSFLSSYTGTVSQNI